MVDNEERKKTIIATTIALIGLLIFIIIFASTKTITEPISIDAESIKASESDSTKIRLTFKTYKTYDNTIYYDTDRTLDEDLDNYKIIEDYIKENNTRGLKLYAMPTTYEKSNDGTTETIIRLYQITNNVILDRTYTIAGIKDGHLVETPNSSYFINEGAIDTTDIKTVTEIRNAATSLIKTHIDKIGTENITGDITLRYDGDVIYYDINFNNDSNIKMDAETGEVIKATYRSEDD